MRDASGKLLARAAYSPKSQIRARVWTFDPPASGRRGLLPQRIQKALGAARGACRRRSTPTPCAWCNGESDGLPGLVVDRYADVLVAQFLAAGRRALARRRSSIALRSSPGCEAIFERSDAEVRKLEGLEPRVGFVRGNRNASRCPIVEHGLNFRVDVEQGQKTGFFLDQRENRQRVRALAAGREVLDGFCYTGGFAIAALAGGAKRVDRDRIARRPRSRSRKRTSRRTRSTPRTSNSSQADVFAHLRTLRDQGAKFDLIVLDPPKFAPTAAHVKNAARARWRAPRSRRAVGASFGGSSTIRSYFAALRTCVLEHVRLHELCRSAASGFAPQALFFDLQRVDGEIRSRSPASRGRRARRWRSRRRG